MSTPTTAKKGREIDRLLNPRKRKWKGAEAGKIVIYSYIEDIRQSKAGEKRHPLLTQEEYGKIVSTIPTEEEYQIYGIFEELFRAILDTHGRKDATYDKFDNGYYHLLYVFNEVVKSDQALKALDYTPLIMTEEQYNRTREEDARDRREISASYRDLLFHVLMRFTKDTKANTPAPIKKELDALKATPATNYPELAKAYNRKIWRGYYVLPSGKRSDEMTAEEWETAVREEYIKCYKIAREEGETAEDSILRYQRDIHIKCHELAYKGGDTIRQFLQDAGITELDATDDELENEVERISDNYKISYLGLPRPFPRFSQLTQQLETALGIYTPVQWLNYPDDEIPAGLTAFDLLDILEVADLTPRITLFEDTFPALFKALTSYIEEHVPPTPWITADTHYRTWGELADAGVIGYKEKIYPSSRINVYKEYSRNRTLENATRCERYSMSGVSILIDPQPWQIDNRGNFNERRKPLSFFETLYTLEANKKGKKDLNEYIRDYINRALRYVYSFKALMRIFEEVYKIEGLAEATKFDESYFENKLTEYNNQLYTFYHEVCGKDKELERKRAIIKEIFPPLSSEELQPKAEDIKAVKDKYKRAGFSSPQYVIMALKRIDNDLNRLMYGREEVEG